MASSEWRWEVWNLRGSSLSGTDSPEIKAESQLWLEDTIVKGKRRRRNEQRIIAMKRNTQYQWLISSHTHTYTLFWKHVDVINPNIKESKKERMNLRFSRVVTWVEARLRNWLERTMCLFVAGLSEWWFPRYLLLY